MGGEGGHQHELCHLKYSVVLRAVNLPVLPWNMKKIVVLTGAGISAESGIPTFRDAGGLWEGHRVEDVATPEGWAANRELVLDFYNQRRKKALEVKPNRGH